MSETYTQQSKKHICSLTLKDLESKKSKFEFLTDKSIINPRLYRDLIVFTPTTQSNLGEKFSNKIQKHIDELVDDILSGLDIKHTYFFASFESGKEKKDLSNGIKTDTRSLIALYCPNSFTESLYASIRNALAHGNIAKKGKFYYLYSVSSKLGIEIPDNEKRITFLLKIHDLDKLKSYIEAFEKYN